MTYPKQVTEQSLAAARERLLAAGFEPEGMLYAENMAQHVEEDSEAAEECDPADYDGEPCELKCSRAEMLAHFDDCPEMWHAIEMTCGADGNSEGFKDQTGMVWLLFEMEPRPSLTRSVAPSALSGLRQRVRGSLDFPNSNLPDSQRFLLQRRGMRWVP
jgi:hypothetical protein